MWHPESDMALDNLSAPDNLSRFLSLPSLVFSLDPASFLRVQQASRAQREELASVLGSWYWRRLILLQLPERGILTVLKHKEAKGALTEASEWRQVFLDFDNAFVNAELMSTDAEYRNFYSAKNKKQLQPLGAAPPDISFDNLPVNSCRLLPYRRLGGDRIVIGNQPLPSQDFCTSTRHENEWRLGYRMVRGYFEVTLGAPADQDARNTTRIPCVSVGLCTSDIQPKAVRTKQVGWCKESWGLHSDDGNIYHCGGLGSPLSPYDLPDLLKNVKKKTGTNASAKATFGVGDTLGCGIIHLPSTAGSNECTRGVFYTKNGEFLGVAFLLQAPHRELYPCAGIDAHFVVQFNFGARPFAYDIDSLGQILVQQRTSAVPTSASAAEFLESSAPSGPPKARWQSAALQVIRRAVKSMNWIKRRGRDLVQPFVGAEQHP
jgi:hypothetical protein